MAGVTSSVVGGAEQPTVGVPFVHGIGVQPRGHTLAEFGGPLVEWLADWYDGLHGEWINRGNVGFEDLERWLADLPTMDPRRVHTLRSLLDRAPRKAPGAPAVDLAAVPNRSAALWR